MMTETTPKQTQTEHKIDPAILEQLKSIYNRRLNSSKLSPEVVKKIEKDKKNKRRISNKSRSINQKKNKLNKFQR